MEEPSNDRGDDNNEHTTEQFYSYLQSAKSELNDVLSQCILIIQHSMLNHFP